MCNGPCSIGQLIPAHPGHSVCFYAGRKIVKKLPVLAWSSLMGDPMVAGAKGLVEPDEAIRSYYTGDEKCKWVVVADDPK